MKIVNRIPKGARDLGFNWYAHSYVNDKYLYHVVHEGEDNEYIERVPLEK